MECRTCKYWRVDRGIFCVNGWTGDGEHGDCRLERVTIPKRADDFCRDYEAKKAAARKEEEHA